MINDSIDSYFACGLVNGNWGHWTPWTLIQNSWKSKRSRKCDNPVPHGATAKDCVGNAEEIGKQI